MLTADRLLRDYFKGLRTLEGHPCSLCATGAKFSDIPHFHGSDFGKCLRSVQFEKVVNGVQEHDDQTAAMFRDGHIHEQATADFLRAGGHTITGRENGNDEFTAILSLNSRTISLFTLPSYLPVGPRQLMIVGHTDGVIEFEDRRYLFEHKAVKDWAFENKFRRGKVPENYVGQCRCYMTCLDLDGGFVFSKNRHTSEPLCHPVARDDAFFWTRAEALAGIAEGHVDGAVKWLPCNPTTDGEQRYCRACKRLRGKV